MVLQTNMSDILARIEDQNRLVKQEAPLSAAPAAMVHQLKSMNLPQQFKDMKLPDLPQAIKVSAIISHRSPEPGDWLKCDSIAGFEILTDHSVQWSTANQYRF